MKRYRIALVLTLCLLVASPSFAYLRDDRDRNVTLSAAYSIPLDPPALEDGGELPPGAGETLSFGAAYRFWGIFNASAHIYSDLIYGVDNWAGMRIRPLGMFSGGFGADIPLGGPNLILDWQRLFTGPSAPNEGVISYAGQFKFGVGFDITDRWNVNVFSRTIRNFSERAREVVDYAAQLEDGNKRFTTIGIGTGFRL